MKKHATKSRAAGKKPKRVKRSADKPIVFVDPQVRRTGWILMTCLALPNGDPIRHRIPKLAQELAMQHYGMGAPS